MTKTNMDLSELLQMQDGGDFLRAVAEVVLQVILEADVDDLPSRKWANARPSPSPRSMFSTSEPDLGGEERQGAPGETAEFMVCDWTKGQG